MGKSFKNVWQETKLHWQFSVSDNTLILIVDFLIYLNEKDIFNGLSCSFSGMPVPEADLKRMYKGKRPDYEDYISDDWTEWLYDNHPEWFFWTSIKGFAEAENNSPIFYLLNFCGKTFDQETMLPPEPSKL